MKAEERLDAIEKKLEVLEEAFTEQMARVERGMWRRFGDVHSGRATDRAVLRREIRATGKRVQELEAEVKALRRKGEVVNSEPAPRVMISPVWSVSVQ